LNGTERQREADIEVELWLDRFLSTSRTCQSIFDIGKSEIKQTLTFPAKIRELPFTARLKVRLLSHGEGMDRGDLEAELPLFSGDGVLEQGRQILVLRPPDDREPLPAAAREALLRDKLVDLGERHLLPQVTWAEGVEKDIEAQVHAELVGYTCLVISLPSLPHPVLFSESRYTLPKGDADEDAGRTSERLMRGWSGEDTLPLVQEGPAVQVPWVLAADASRLPRAGEKDRGARPFAPPRREARRGPGVESTGFPEAATALAAFMKTTKPGAGMLAVSPEDALHVLRGPHSARLFVDQGADRDHPAAHK
jgi:hypothetical protein